MIAAIIVVAMLKNTAAPASCVMAFSFTPLRPRPAFARGTKKALEQSRVMSPIFSLRAKPEDDEDETMDNDEDELYPVVLPQGMEDALTETELNSLTIAQLKQQLRLRGLKVSGRKRDLVDRLLASTRSSSPSLQSTFDDDEDEEDTTATSKARKFAKDQGKELVDVSDYLDEEDKGKSFKSWKAKKDVVDADFEKEENEDEETGENTPEVWGSEARIVDDYEGRRVVIDCLTESVVEFKGSNQSYVSAYVVASRDALKPFLSGGSANQNRTAAEDRLREIQTMREKANKRPVRFEDDEGLNEGDETGLYENAIERDFSDWGKFTLTGAQLSAQEVQGVLLLSDIYGAFTEDTQALAAKIAFECQPVVVMVPDLFRGEPWKESSTPGKNSKGETYEEWRATHDDLRVSIDIRAAAACLRERYGVSSIVVWGTCYGGGRALEASAGYLPQGKIHDFDGTVGPPLVDPMACVAWYPTRYNASTLFGKNHAGNELNEDGQKREFAVMGVFAGNDNLPGATSDDASQLKALLSEDTRVKDFLVKVFPGQDHGFAHIGLGSMDDDNDDYFGRFVDDEFGGAGKVSLADGDADVACLLSTAFMETYSRVFLPTAGAGSIKGEQNGWSTELEMKDLSETVQNDVRSEIEEALNNFVEEPLAGLRVDPTDPDSRQEMENYLRELQKGVTTGPYRIEDDDDLETMYAKLKAQDENFQLF